MLDWWEDEAEDSSLWDWHLLWIIPLGSILSPIFGILIHAYIEEIWGYLTVLIALAFAVAGEDSSYL